MYRYAIGAALAAWALVAMAEDFEVTEALPDPFLMNSGERVRTRDDWQRRRLSMRPGITCLWQVRGRNKITDFAEWAQLDLEYIDNWSLWLDFRILLKTIPVVLFAVGAK